MTQSRGKLPDSIEYLLRDQLVGAIDQANLGQFDTRVAKRYLIDRLLQNDIAAELGCDRSSVSRRIPHIIAKVEWAAKQLYGTG